MDPMPSAGMVATSNSTLKRGYLNGVNLVNLREILQTAAFGAKNTH